MSDLTQEESDNYWDALHPPRPAPPEREILTDLIAESRAWLAGDHPEPMVWMLDRAERRLRQVRGE